MYQERQAERKICTRRDRQRGKYVPEETGREEDMYQERQAERKICTSRDRQRVRGILYKERQAERKRRTKRDRQIGRDIPVETGRK